jgi:hypothetical protein
MKQQTSGSISMNHSGSVRGGYNTTSLTTGEWIPWRQWTALPMTDWVIQYVHVIATVEDQ